MLVAKMKKSVVNQVLGNSKHDKRKKNYFYLIHELFNANQLSQHRKCKNCNSSQFRLYFLSFFIFRKQQ